MSKSTFNPLACAMAGVAAVLSMAHCPAIADQAVERGRSARARILDAVKAGGGTIDISEGTYVFDAAEAEDRMLCISSGEQPSRRKVVFPIEGVKGLTISGHGAKFLFRGQAVPFAILGSRDVVLNGVSVGWEPPCPAVLVAGGCSNVIVRGNVFSNCLASARHRCPAKLLHVDSADGVAFRDNRIFMRGDCAAWPEQKLFSVSNSANMTIGMEKSVPPDWLDKVVLIESTFDGTAQFAYYEPPPGEGKAPLLVGLHTWSYDLSNLSHYVCELNWCRRNGWGFIAPNCRGPNWTPPACGGEAAVQDIVDAVEWAKRRGRVDPDRVCIIGGSGGGHMTLLMAGRHPEIWAGCCAFCPIVDLEAWHEESKALRSNYWRHIEAACGGAPAARPEEYALRSPLTHLKAAKGVSVMIGTGIHDGHKGRGSVPVTHTLRAFNALADEKDRISDADIDYMFRNELVPEHLAFSGDAPFYPHSMRVLLRRTSNNAQVTIFEGGHACNFSAGLDFLLRQRRGQPADWSLPKTGKSGIQKLTK